jgi:intracellular sulfur oxidation DsrE/DsrF family protein
MKSTVIVINKKGMGYAPDDLSHALLQNYLNLLLEEKKLPFAILLYGEGVKLVCEDSSIVDIMKRMEASGIKIIACKTCLNYFDVGNVKAGQIGSMSDIVTIQMEASKVITV